MPRKAHTQPPVAALTADLAQPAGAIAVAALVSDLSLQADNQPPSEILLLPAGRFQARDGRPATASGFWELDASGAQQLIAAASAARGDYVIDYEHQTLNSQANGQPAPAAGWFKTLEWRDGTGLWAKVRWTAAAAKAITAGEYRYISPVFSYAKDGRVLSLLMAALTNFPALDGHSDLATLAAARFSLPTEDSPLTEAQLAALRAALKLDKDADADAINAAVTALAGKVAAGDDAIASLKTRTDELAALKSQATTPDPDKWVPKAVYEEAQAASRATAANSEQAALTALIKQGVADGRIPGQATATWLQDQGLAACKTYLESAPALAGLSGTQTGGKDPAAADKTKTGKDALTEDDLAVCTQMGIDPADYAKHLETAQ